MNRYYLTLLAVTAYMASAMGCASDRHCTAGSPRTDDFYSARCTQQDHDNAVKKSLEDVVEKHR